MIKQSRFFGLLVASFAILLTVSAKKIQAAGSEIKIGEYASLTGKEASFGQTSHQGIVLALEEINKSGGVLGRNLKLITEDDQTVPGMSATVVRKLISRDKVIALLGEVSSNRTLEAAPIAVSKRVPVISIAATNSKVTEVGNYIFRVCYIDPFQGTLLARFAIEDLKVKRVGIISSASNSYSIGLAKFFTERFSKGGGVIAQEMKFADGDKDFRAQLTALRAAKVEAVFVPAFYTEAALIVRQARELGLSVPFFGGDGWGADELLQIGGSALNGCYYSTHFSPDDQSPNVADFVSKYKTRWGRAPDATSALGYDAALLLVDALKRAGAVDGPRLRDALAATKSFPGVTGDITIDEQRNASKPATIIKIDGGHVTFFKRISP